MITTQLKYIQYCNETLINRFRPEFTCCYFNWPDYTFAQINNIRYSQKNNYNVMDN